jgi:tetratricopeptide (TPR) repeat protein
MERPQMRKINHKVLLAFLASLILLTGVVFGVHYLQRQRIASALLWQARKAEETGQIERNVLYLGRYLEFQPNDLEEKAHLGKVLLSEDAHSGQGSRARAVDLLDEVLRQQPERVTERRLLVKGALTIPNANRSKQARESLLLLLDPAKPQPGQMSPTDLGELEGFWGALFEQEGNLNEAIAWCRKATKNRPEEQINYMRLVYLLRRQNTDTPEQKAANLAEANQVMNQLVEKNRTSAEALLARWRYRREYDLVEIQGQPRKPDMVAFEEAIHDVRDALKAAPENIDVLLAAADVERLQNDRKTARDHLKRALDILAKQGRTNPHDGQVQQVHWQLGNLLLDNALIERENITVRDAFLAEAGPSIDVLRRSRGMPAAADYLEGRANFQRGKWREATDLLERARAQLNDKRDLMAQIDLFLGQCHEKLDDPVNMQRAFERVLAYDPANVAAEIGRASALWMQGQIEPAKDIYRRVVTGDKVPASGLIDLARLELASQMQRERSKREWKAAEATLKAADEANLRSFDVALLRVELLAAQEKYTDAKALLARAIQEKPKREVDLWVLSADLDRRRGKRDEARAVLDEATKTLGDSPELRLERVQIAMDGPQTEVLAALQEAERGSDALSIEAQAQLLEGLAGAYFRLGNMTEARRVASALAKNPVHKNDLRLQLLLLDLALRSNDDAAVSAILETLRSVEQTSGPYTRYGQAMKALATARKLETNDKNRDAALEEAKRQLDMVARLRSSWAPVHGARAEVFELQGNLAAAIPELRAAIQAGDTSTGVVQRLVRALLARQRDNEADVELQKLRQTLVSTAELRKLDILVKARRGDLKGLVDLIDQETALNTNDSRDVVWMALMLATAGKFDQAETLLRKATTATPKEPEPWVALVQLLVERHRDEEATALLREAEGKVDPKRKALLMALGLEALGKLPDGMVQIQQAEEADPNNLVVLRHAVRFYLRLGKFDLAEATLRRVLQGKVPAATGEDRDWARRGLALTLANGTDFVRFREALELVGLPLDEKGRLPRDPNPKLQNVELIRTQARVLATQPQNSYRGRAIELFERLDKAQSLNDDDKLMLALLQERSGAWDKARTQYELLAGKPGLGPQPLVQLILGLMREKEPDLAERYLTQLEKLEKDRGVAPGVFGSLELRSRLLEETGQIDKALEMLRSHVERKDAPPEERLVLVAFCARHKRNEDGLKICREARATCRPEAISGATVALLRTIKASDEDCKEVQAWLGKLIDANPKKMVLHMHLANLYDYRGMYREAEQEYREILKPGNEPNNVVALNNLAWLLALQTGRADEALEIVTKAIYNAGRRPELLDTRGVILLNLGRAEEAVVDLKEVAADAPSAIRLFHLARAYQAVKDRVNATHTLRKSKEMGLQTESMHPVEQEACKKLLSDLKL